MKFDAVRIVLVNTSHPGNIGSVARAMKTMGFSKLYLVAPKILPEEQALQMAANAKDVLESVIITKTLKEAIFDCHLVFATTARTRGVSLEELTPKQASIIVDKHIANTKIALVFGPENSGLSNKDFFLCHYCLYIPGNPAYNSLNLSQAVQIILYELRMQFLLGNQYTNKSAPLAVSQEMEHFYTHLEEILVKINFLNLKSPKRLLSKLRRLFNRSSLLQVEVNILRGILKHVDYALEKKRGN